MSIPLYERAAEASRYISSRTPGRTPRAAVVLGSGLGEAAESLVDNIEIDYKDIPHFPVSTVEGHPGKLVVGSCDGVDTVAMRGRFHFYEGYSMEDITLPIRAFAIGGIRTLILTNAAGGISPELTPGSLMVIKDHINLMGDNPLRGQNDERFGPRFPDMTEVYSGAYRACAYEVAGSLGIQLHEGVYMALRGPSYETPAEIMMVRKLGADAIGMSTVPEATVARHCGIKLLAISCITNVAAGLSDLEIDHQEVMKVGAVSGKHLARLIFKLIPRLVALEGEIRA